MQKANSIVYRAQWLHRDLIIPVVERIPADHEIWFIGDNAPAGYVMACLNDGYSVIPETLKAIRLSDDEKKIITYAAGFRNNNLKQCLATIATSDEILNRNYAIWDKDKKKASAIDALPIFERITDTTNPTADAQGASCRLQEAAV